MLWLLQAPTQAEYIALRSDQLARSETRSEPVYVVVAFDLRPGRHWIQRTRETGVLASRIFRSGQRQLPLATLRIARHARAEIKLLRRADRPEVVEAEAIAVTVINK